MKCVSEGNLLHSLVRWERLRELQAKPEFCRKFRKWCKSNDIDISDFKNDFKSCLVCKFIRSQHKYLFQYSLDMRFMKEHRVVCGPECQKSHKMVNVNGREVVQRCLVATENRWNYYKTDGVVDGRTLTFEDLEGGRTVCERTEPNRPAKFAIDADASWANMKASCAGKPPPKNGYEFANYLLEVFQNVISTKLSIERTFRPVVCYKSDYHPSMEFGEDMKAKCSYHIIMDEFWMPDWRTYGKMIAQLMLDVDHERHSWLQDDVLDTSVYGNYKLFGCVLSGKFTDYETQGADYRRMIPDPLFPEVSSYLIHCYDEKQPECLNIPIVKSEMVVPTREGSCPEIAQKKVSKRTAKVYANYKASGILKKTLESTTSAGYIKVMNFTNAHWINDVTITRCYVIMAKFEQVAQTTAWERLRQAAAATIPQSADEQRRVRRVLSGRHFRIYWKKVYRPTPTEYVEAATKLQQFSNYELEKGALLRCMLNETLGISPRWAENTVNYRARYADQCVTEGLLRTKVNCFRFGMGQGKSSLMRKWIQTAANCKKRVLVITSSLALCDTWKQDLLKCGLSKAAKHEDFHESWMRPDLCPLYVTTFQSLWKVGNAKYDYIFIDEIVLVKEDATCAATNDNISANMFAFGQKLHYAKKVIAADALLSSLELEWLEEFVPKKEITIHHNKLKWGELGTRTKRAYIYPRHNITMKRSQTPASSMWYLSLKKHLNKNTDTLTHIHITPKKDMNSVMSTCCAHAAIDFLRPQLTKITDIDDLILQFADLLKPGQTRRSLYSMTHYKQTPQEIGACLKADAERLKHSSKAWYSTLWTNSSVTAGISWDMPTAYTSTWLCSSTFIPSAQRMFQAVNRIRRTRNNTEQSLHFCVKELDNKKPDLYGAPLGKFATFADCMSRSSDVIKEIAKDVNQILRRCWATNMYKRALWQKFPTSCMTFLLKNNHWKVTYLDSDGAKHIARPKAKHLRQKRKISTIQPVNEEWMEEFGKMTFNKKRRRVYDQTAKTTKFLLEKTKATGKKTTIHYALKQMNICPPDELAAIKNVGLETILQEWTPQNECRAVLEREHEVVLRLKGDTTTPPCWKEGLKLLDAVIRDNDKTNTFHTWRDRKSAVNAIRWLRCGYCIDQAQEQLLENEGIFGQWNDSFIPKFRLVSDLEKVVFPDPVEDKNGLSRNKHFPECLQITKDQYDAAIGFIEANMSKYKQRFSGKTATAVFRDVLNFYALQLTKFRNDRPGTRPIDLSMDLPTQRQKQQLVQFFNKLKEGYPLLHASIVNEVGDNHVKMLQWWKKNAVNRKSYSLVSKLSKTPNTRLYWRLNDKGM